MGVTWAIFQSCIVAPLLNDVLKIMNNGIGINSLTDCTDFIIEIGQTSDSLLCVFTISTTIPGVKSIDSGTGVEPVGVYCMDGGDIFPKRVEK